MAEYVKGTRQWLYEVIDKWIDDATNGLGTNGGGGGAEIEEEKALCMFMLLAGPVS